MAFPYRVPFGAHGNNPTLIPTFDTPVVKNGVITLTTGSNLEAQANGVSSTGSITVAGTVSVGNVVTVNVTNGVLPGGVVSVPYTATGTDTVDTVAASLAMALNTNATLSQYGWRFGTNGLGVIDCLQRGAVGNFSTLSASSTGAETFTYTQMAGGSGVVVPLTNFTFSFNNTVSQYWYGKPVFMSFMMMQEAVSQGVPLS